MDRQTRDETSSELLPAPAGELLPALPAGHSAHISARSDAEAVGLWLAEYRASPQTRRAYRREAERLLLWLAEQGLALGEVRRDHLDAFEAFLADPRPRERWVGPPRPRHADDWRPFRGPLAPASRRQSLVILQGMFAWLVEAGWVAHNPFRLMRDKRRRLDNRQGGIERYLERPLWAWFWSWLDRPVEESASPRQRYEWQRRRLVFGFAYLLAPRIGEMSAARMGDFHRREGRWWWRVTGKGDKTRMVPVLPQVREATQAYLALQPFVIDADQHQAARRVQHQGLDHLHAPHLALRSLEAGQDLGLDVGPGQRHQVVLAPVHGLEGVHPLLQEGAEPPGCGMKEAFLPEAEGLQVPGRVLDEVGGGAPGTDRVPSGGGLRGPVRQVAGHAPQVHLSHLLAVPGQESPGHELEEYGVRPLEGGEDVHVLAKGTQPVRGQVSLTPARLP